MVSWGVRRIDDVHAIHEGVCLLKGRFTEVSRVRTFLNGKGSICTSRLGNISLVNEVSQ